MANLTPDQSALLERLGKDPALLVARANRTLAERKLVDFMEMYWGVLHPGKKMRRGWALEAICDHLEGVSAGHIKQLLITVPPGFSKSMATNVFWPAWEWGPKRRPDLQYLSAAYTDELTQRDNERARTLMGSDEYRANWGDVFSFDRNVDGRIKFMNDRRGHKQATSVKGQATGGRGDRLIADDPHNVLSSDSDQVRQETVRWFTEAWPTRTNSGDSVFVVIMQRVHEMDVAQACIELGYTHLCIPMMFESDHPHRWVGGGHIAHEPVRKRVEAIEAAAIEVKAPVTRMEAYETFMHTKGAYDVCAEPGYVTDGEQTQVSTAPQYGLGDPRTEDDELAFPELFDEARVRRQQRQMMLTDLKYAVDGQQQQRPSPRGGGDIKDEYIIYVDEKDVPAGGSHVEAGWDLAGSTGKKSPYTVKIKGKYGPDGVLYILGRAKERVESDKLDSFILREMDTDGKRKVRHNLPQDPGQAGKYQKRSMAQKFKGHWFVFSPETGDKQTRARPVVSQFGAKNVRIVRGTWNKDLVSNLKKWPAGKYKDDMDALSRMDMGLTERNGKKRAIPVAQMIVNYSEARRADMED